MPQRLTRSEPPPARVRAQDRATWGGRMQEREEQAAREQIEDMEERARQMEERSEEADQNLETTRSGWEARKAEDSAPGAQDEEGASDTNADELRERRDQDEG